MSCKNLKKVENISVVKGSYIIQAKSTSNRKYPFKWNIKMTNVPSKGLKRLCTKNFSLIMKKKRNSGLF